jgi:hypothetical protein
MAVARSPEILVILYSAAMKTTTEHTSWVTMLQYNRDYVNIYRGRDVTIK